MPLILLRFAIISMGNNAGDTTQAASASFDLVINDNLLQFDFGPRVIGGSILTCSPNFFSRTDSISITTCTLRSR